MNYNLKKCKKNKMSQLLKFKIIKKYNKKINLKKLSIIWKHLNFKKIKKFIKNINKNIKCLHVINFLKGKNGPKDLYLQFNNSNKLV